MAVSIGIFFVVIGAATFHAIWNFMARKVKGNIGVIWLAFFIGSLMFAPVGVYFLIQDLNEKSGRDLLIGCGLSFASAVIHTLYLVLLAFAYQGGEYL